LADISNYFKAKVRIPSAYSILNQNVGERPEIVLSLTILTLLSLEKYKRNL